MSNFSQFAGESVTIRAETEGDATLAIDWIETRFDTVDDS